MAATSTFLSLAGLAAVFLAMALGLSTNLLRRPARLKALTSDGVVDVEVGTGESAGMPDRLTALLALMAAVALGGAIVARVVATQRPPYASLWEYSLVLSFLILVLSLAFARRLGAHALSTATLPLVASLLLAAQLFLPSQVEPLVPALQNNRLLALHVLSMLVSYGAMGVAFVAAVTYLVQERSERCWLPPADVAEEIERRAVMLGFPLLGLGIALGAYWANSAWGRYWGWDPKETTALAAWLVYAAYMHARALSNWRGRRTALLAVLGFGVILFNIFAVNFVISGLHSYAG